MKWIILLACLLFVAPSYSKEKVPKNLYVKLSKAKKTNSEKSIVKAVSEILSIDLNDKKALNTLAIFYYEAKKYNMAKLVLERGIKAHPDHPGFKNNMALVHFANDDRKKALLSLKDATKDAKEGSEAFLNLSSIYVEHRDYDRALGPLSKIYSSIKSKLKTKSVAAVALANNYAVSLVGAGKLSKAEKVFAKAQDAGVRDTNLLYNYAIYMVDQGKSKDAAYKVISRLKFLSEDKNILRKVEQLEKTLDNKK